jgi:Macrocin-O-methyltransferase (TylF)
LNKILSATHKLYDENKNIIELEHQVGRFLNIREICKEISATGLEGDVLEFGSWQGLGLILRSHCFLGDKSRRKLIGIDSFEGLPETSTMWVKGDFDNTSIELARKNIQAKMNPAENLSFELIQGWFSDTHVLTDLLKISNNIMLIHFDADLGISTVQALALVETYLINRKKPLYFLFDDWGCHPDEVPDTFLSWLDLAGKRLNLRADKIYSTRYTRYYKISFKD